MRVPALLFLLPLAACGGGTANTTTVEKTVQRNVTREVEVPVEPTPAAVPAAAAASGIQTQPGPGGSQVTLNKVAVTGDVMTVQLTYTGGSGYQMVKIDEVSVIDDSSARQLGVLKDNSGKWLAAPLGSADRLAFSLGNASVIVWFKFPAPPATSATVSINIPGAAPFDGVAVTR